MAAILLNDGTMEPVVEEPKYLLRRIIEEHLGWDCAKLLDEIIEDSEEEIKILKQEVRDYESSADGYMGMCHDATNGIEECISMIDTSKRLDKQALRRRLKEVHDDIYNNL